MTTANVGREQAAFVVVERLRGDVTDHDGQPATVGAA